MFHYSLLSVLIGRNRRCQSEWGCEERAGLAQLGLAWLFRHSPALQAANVVSTAMGVISLTGSVKGSLTVPNYPF